MKEEKKGEIEKQRDRGRKEGIKTAGRKLRREEEMEDERREFFIKEEKGEEAGWKEGIKKE